MKFATSVRAAKAGDVEIQALDSTVSSVKSALFVVGDSGSHV